MPQGIKMRTNFIVLSGYLFNFFFSLLKILSTNFNVFKFGNLCGKEKLKFRDLRG